MKRFKKIYEPRMIGVRVERSKYELFEQNLRSQPHLTLQDFFSYVIDLYNDGYIAIDGQTFRITERASYDLK